MTANPTDRAYGEALDERDALAALRGRFRFADPDLVYLDGNSLGMLPEATAARLRRVVDDEWGASLVRGWQDWVELPTKVGDLLGTSLLGAAPGQVVVCDSITVNLYKATVLALGLRPGRRVLVTDDDNFPTDRYVLEGVAADRGLDLRVIASDPVHGVDPFALEAALDEDVALVSLSHVAYRSGALADMRGITELVHRSGALTLWDLAHSAGSVPVALDDCDADLAVGCTYKYLNAGPGAPAFVYVRADLHGRARQPVWGWFGQRDQFAMGPSYDPAPGATQFLTGTPNVLGAVAVEEGVKLLAEAGIDALRRKSVALTSYLIELSDAWLSPYGVEVVTPRQVERRGGHVSLRHDDAYRLARALIEQASVVPDFRAPDRLRLGPAPVTTRFVDVWEGMRRLRDVLADRRHLELADARARVT
ncbi:MAG: kynureninase [Actinomycetota bacterium]|nr:kynureninase [Actinomycetota bacterium]